MGFAKHRGMRVIAAGVETSAQAEALKSLGCRYQQGHYFQPAADLEKILDLVGKRATYPDEAALGVLAGSRA
jgi:EAL domain-containing protein (putative c-di-GMP-specific phosphodiesterase class I)